MRLGLRNKRDELPIPPLEMRELVGLTDPSGYDPPADGQVFPALSSPRQYDLVLDFGCGCGRLARQLALGTPTPRRYVGIDLHTGMINWCNANLAPRLRNFSFLHHNVYNPGLNPNPEAPMTAPLPVEDASVSLLIAWSVFTHLVQDQATAYLDEVQRALREDGVALATFFLFEKRFFPMMQDFQNALYINPSDLTNAVVFDREWLMAELVSRGLAVRHATPPSLRGFQWTLTIGRGKQSVRLPEDQAPFGRMPPPQTSRPAHTIGHE